MHAAVSAAFSQGTLFQEKDPSSSSKRARVLTMKSSSISQPRDGELDADVVQASIHVYEHLHRVAVERFRCSDVEQVLVMVKEHAALLYMYRKQVHSVSQRVVLIFSDTFSHLHCSFCECFLPC